MSDMILFDLDGTLTDSEKQKLEEHLAAYSMHWHPLASKSRIWKN